MNQLFEFRQCQTLCLDCANERQQDVADVVDEEVAGQLCMTENGHGNAIARLKPVGANVSLNLGKHAGGVGERDEQNCRLDEALKPRLVAVSDSRKPDKLLLSAHRQSPDLARVVRRRRQDSHPPDQLTRKAQSG